MTMPLTTPRLQEWAIGLAAHMARLSKDPSTQVGAAIFDSKRRLVSAGYNGLPRGVEDTSERLHERNIKYQMVRHAEANALAFATASTEGCTLVVTHPCCPQCAGAAIQHGIAHVLWPAPSAEFLYRWQEAYDLTRTMFREAGVRVVEQEDLGALKAAFDRRIDD